MNVDAMKWALALVLALASGCGGESGDAGGPMGGPGENGRWPGPCTVELDGDDDTGEIMDTLASEREGDPDGMVDSRATYTYDANGNLLTEEVDGDGDGERAADWRATYTYDCWE